MFGGMNLFARAIGGWVADKCGNRWGLAGRVKWLFIALFGEGIGLMLFSQATTLTLAIPLMITFAMFVKMSNGATYAVVPFINRRALGAVSGIVGAGGNAGAVRSASCSRARRSTGTRRCSSPGVAVTCISFASFLITFRAEAERESAHRPIGDFRRRLAGERNGDRRMIAHPTTHPASSQQTVVVIGNGMVGQRFCETAGRVRHRAARIASSRSARSRGRPTTASA